MGQLQIDLCQRLQGFAMATLGSTVNMEQSIQDVGLVVRAEASHLVIKGKLHVHLGDSEEYHDIISCPDNIAADTHSLYRLALTQNIAVQDSWAPKSAGPRITAWGRS